MEINDEAMRGRVKRIKRSFYIRYEDTNGLMKRINRATRNRSDSRQIVQF